MVVLLTKDYKSRKIEYRYLEILRRRGYELGIIMNIVYHELKVSEGFA